MTTIVIDQPHTASATQRLLELVYTACNLRPFAEDVCYHHKPIRWTKSAASNWMPTTSVSTVSLVISCVRYILDPKEVYGEDFPGETFRVLKEKEIKQFGEYRTRRLVLEAWDGLGV
jgi:hypothetical protein